MSLLEVVVQDSITSPSGDSHEPKGRRKPSENHPSACHKEVFDLTFMQPYKKGTTQRWYLTA
jgi:hypothetical protein